MDPVATIPRGTIAPARLRIVLNRLASGFYDQTDVWDQVVARALPDLI